MLKAETLTYDLIEKVMKKKGYPFYKGPMNLNLVGIRTTNVRPDNYDDFFVIAYEDNYGEKRTWVCERFTTDPGTYYLQQKLLNPKGCAIMVPGHYPGLWAIGLHQGKYEALVQVGSVKVYRDGNKNAVLDFDPDTIQTSAGLGINCHHGYDSKSVGRNSAGCQVHGMIADHALMMHLVKRSIATKKYGNKLSYTLLLETDILDQFN